MPEQQATFTQAELTEYARIDQQLEDLEARKEVLRASLLAKQVVCEASKINPTTEEGSLRIEVKLGTKKGSVQWKEVIAVVESKNATYVNGGGKMVPLNKLLPELEEKLVGAESRNDRVKVKPNIK